MIQKFIEDIPGGRSLDVSGLPEEDKVVLAGHVIIRETATKEYKALGYAGDAYVTLPADHEYAGILYVSIRKDEALASIMVRGTVNEKAAVDAQGLPEYQQEAKDALDLIRFVEA